MVKSKHWLTTITQHFRASSLKINFTKITTNHSRAQPASPGTHRTTFTTQTLAFSRSKCDENIGFHFVNTEPCLYTHPNVNLAIRKISHFHVSLSLGERNRIDKNPRICSICIRINVRIARFRYSRGGLLERAPSTEFKME